MLDAISSSFPRASRPRALLLAALAAAAACGPAPEPVAPQMQPATDAATGPKAAAKPSKPLVLAPDPSSVERIRADVTYLASPELAGRGTGEEGARLAAEMIAKRFAELNLVPFGDAGQDKTAGYRQKFEARVGATIDPPVLAVETGTPAKKTTADAAGIVTADGSASGSVSGEVVFVGYGIKAPALGWDDYKGADVTGKIVVVLHGAPTLSGKDRRPPAPPQGEGAHGSPAAAAHGSPAAAHGSPAPAHGAPDAAANAHTAHGAPVALHPAPTPTPMPVPHGQPAGDKPGSDPHAAHGKDAAAKPGSDLIPKDALRDFGSIRYKLRTAREAKAAGIVIIAAGEELPIAPSDASSMGIPGVVVKRALAKRLVPGAKADDKRTWDAQKSAAPKVLAKTSLSITTRVTPLMAEAWNVVGMLPARQGSKLASEYVVMGAHYDHLGHGGTSSSRAPGVRAVHPGADDNASGTALMLELARRFAALPEKPARNILFMAFGAEEIGTIGSHHWVEHAPIPIANIAAMVNADMVGRMRENKILVDGTSTAAAWPEIARAATSGLGLDVAFGGEGFGASDQASFTAARVPVTFLFTGVHDDYHKPSDTADKINVEGVERAATLAGRLVLAVSEREERLAFVDAPADPHRGTRGGFRVSLGTVPDYAFTGKGMKLTGVRPDAPAARAGLKGGDVIVKVGAHEITNVHDFMFALGDLEPGREVVVVVLRDGAQVELKVTPAPGR